MLGLRGTVWPFVSLVRRQNAATLLAGHMLSFMQSISSEVVGGKLK